MHISFGPCTSIRAIVLRLYIPDRDRDGNEVEHFHYWVNEARLLFTRTFGGSMCIPRTLGTWKVAESNTVIHETTAIVSSFVAVRDVVANLDVLRAFLQDILYFTKPDTVAVEFDGRLHFVGAEGDYRCSNILPMTPPAVGTDRDRRQQGSGSH